MRSRMRVVVLTSSAVLVGCAIESGDPSGAGDIGISTTNALTANTAPVAHIDRPYYDNAKYLVGHVLKFAGTATDAEDGTVPAANCRWTILKGTTQVATATGLSGSYAFPTSVSAPTTYTIRFKATDSKGASSTTQLGMTLLPLEGDLVIGTTQAGGDYETALMYFTVAAAEVGKYYHVDVTTPQGPSGGFIVSGDRAGYTGDFTEADEKQRRAADGFHLNPQVEFRSFAAGEYTLGLDSQVVPHYSWEEPAIARSHMSVHYKITTAWSSPAAPLGKSVVVDKDLFPDTFYVDGKLVNKSTFDFAGLQAGFNQVWVAYRNFMGGFDYAKYGSVIGVTFPLNPNYSWCGDAASPLNLACIDTRRKVPSPFEHELAHDFTQAYPFEYYFEINGVGYGNTEPLIEYLVAPISDPRTGGGLTFDEYYRYEAGAFRESNLKSPAFWHDALISRGFLRLYRSVSGGWSALGDTLRSYTTHYAGNAHDTDGYERAKQFYLALAAKLPDSARRQALLAQYRLWGCPFVDAGTAYTDHDGDGIVAGLDPNDNDARINQYTEECTGSLCVRNNVDENQNGFVDESILNPSGETISLGDDNVAYDNDRGTRRKMYLEAGRTVRLSVASQKPVEVHVYKANVPVDAGGPMWWYGAQYGDPISGTDLIPNPVLTFIVPSSEVYTFDFTGHSGDGVNIGDRISYVATMTP